MNECEETSSRWDVMRVWIWLEKVVGIIEV